MIVTKVHEANVDTFSFVDSFSRWVQALEARASYQLRLRTKEFEIGAKEGIDLGSKIKDSFLSYMVLKGGGGLFYHSMLCK